MKIPIAVITFVSCLLTSGLFIDSVAQIKKEGNVKPKIDLPYYRPEIQLKKEHIEAVVDEIKRIPNCRLLVWGTGYDSKLWCAVNENGTTVITEDIPKWADLAKKDWEKLDNARKRCRVVMVKYDTKLKQAK